MNRTILTVAGVLSASSLLLVDSAIKGTVLLAVAAVVALILRRDSAATRHLVWLLVIVAMLVVPVLSAMLPQWRVLPTWMSSSRPVVADVSPSSVGKSTGGVIETPRMAEPFEVERPIATADQRVSALPDSQPASVTPEAVPAPAVRSWNWINALPLVWVVGFAVLMLRLSAARWMLWSSERLATVIRGRVAPQLAFESRSDSATAHDPIVTAMESICSQLGIGRVTLLIHPHKTIPVVWGILRCRLMLPAAARQWSDEQLQSVLLHELAHIKRRDTIVQLLAQVACALHWFNPLVWFAAWRLDVERERSCDDLVLATGIRPSAYAGHLLDVVTGLSPARWTQACGLAMARKSSLEGRLTAVLGKDLNRRGVSVALAGLALAIAVGIAVPIAMLRAADERWNPPQVAHIGGNDFSTFCVHDGKDASFVIAYHGDFGSATSGSANPKSRTWHNEATLTLLGTAEKREVSIRRDHTAPDKLTLAGTDYDLEKGRVFVLSDKGAVRQLDIAIPVVTDQESAKKLAALIAAIPPQEQGTDDLPAWSTSQAGKWPLPGGVTMEVKQHLVHGSDISSTAMLTWPMDHTGGTARHPIWLAGDAFAARDPWLMVWERGATVLWVMNGERQSSQDFHRVLPTPNSLRSIDFSDPEKITETSWNYLPEQMSDVVRAEFAKGFRPMATAPRTPAHAEPSVFTSRAEDLRPVGELLSGVWKSERGPVDVRLAFPERATNEVQWTMTFTDRKGQATVSESLISMETPQDGSVRLIKNYQPIGKDPTEAMLGRLKRGIGDTLLLDTLEHVDFPAYQSTHGIVLVRDSAPGPNEEADVVKPKHKDAQSLYEIWQRYARTNGDIPGALVGEMASAVRQFIKYNPSWRTVPKLNEILPRLDATRDWKAADAIALLDEVAAVEESLLDKNMRHSRALRPVSVPGGVQSISNGEALPKKFADAPWGETQPNGLRAAWVLEPGATEYRMGTALKERLIVQNNGSVAVMARVPTWHPGGVNGVTARDAAGAQVRVSAIHWTTRAILVPVRLMPGEFIEIKATGVGLDEVAGSGPWAGPRVGFKVLAKPGDEITLTHRPIPLDGSEVGVSEDDPHVSGPGWWLAHVKARLNRELPLPADAAERTRLLDRAVRELFATAPTAEETAEFIADKTPDALDALAKRLVARVDVVSFSGKLPTAPAKFRVLAADANADKQPRVVLGPGEYPLPSATAERGDATLKVVGRPVGDRRTNDAQLLFEAVEFTGALPPEPHKLEVPDGWGTWAIVCRPNEGFFYLLSKGTVRKIDYSKPRSVTDTPANDLPAEFRDEVKRILDIHEISAAQQAELFEKPAAPAATPDSKTGANAPAKPTKAGTPKLPKLTDDAYAKPGVHCQKFREEDAKRPGGELMGYVLEPSKPEDREKESLVLGVRTASDAQCRIGGTAKVGLVVRNRTDGIGRNQPGSDVKFSYTGRLDNGLPVVAVDEAGKEHGATIAHFDGELGFQQMLLPVAHVATIKEFTIRFDAEKRGVSEPRVAAFHLPPGKYKLRCKWNDARPDVAHEGEWVGELMNEEFEFTLAAAAPTSETPKNPAAGDQAPKQQHNSQNAKGGAKLERAMLEGAWAGEKDGVRVDLKFLWLSEHQQVGWKLQTPDAGIGVQMSVVMEPDGSAAKFVFRKGLEFEATLGRVTLGERGSLRLELIPNPNPDATKFPAVKDLVLTRQPNAEEQKPAGGAILKPATEAPSKATEKLPFTAWGEEVNGVQIGVQLGEPRIYEAGESATLILRLRNNGKVQVPYRYGDEYFLKNPPLITDASGKAVTIKAMSVFGSVLLESVAPGKEVDLVQLKLDLRPATDRSKDAAWTIYGTGKFQIQYPVAGVVGEFGSDLPGMKLTTGKLELEVKEPFTAWGEAINGLQAGLGFKAGEKRVYTHGDPLTLDGETATLVVRLRNVSKEEIKFQYLRQYFIENPPTVTNAEGKLNQLGKIAAFGEHIPQEVKLAPGKEIELYEWKPYLGSGNEEGMPKYPYIFGAGKFQVQYEKVFGNSSASTIKLDPALEKLATGKLELEVKAPEKAPVEKEPFTAWGKEVGGMQAGLGFKAGEKRVYTHGETATLVLRVRNVGKEAVEFKHIWAYFVENPPAITDADGKPVQFPKYLAEGKHLPRNPSIAPGKEVDLYDWQVKFLPKGDTSKAHDVIRGTGKFSVQYDRIVGPTSGNPEDPNPAMSKLATGKLELEVKEPEKLPAEKEAFTPPSKAEAAPGKPKPNYVTVVGQLLDDATGLPIEKAGWEWGMADPKKPEVIAWGHSRSMGGSHPGGKFEMLVNIGANGHHYPLRVYSAGYETTVVVDELAKPYPEKIERIVRLRRGRGITGVLRDHAGKPVANGWVFFIPKGHRSNIVEGVPGTDAHQLNVDVRDGAVAEIRTNADGTFALSTGVEGTLAASTDLVDLWPFPLPVDGYAELKMPAPSYLVIDLTYWYLDELAKKGKRALSPSSEDPNQCWIQVDQSGSAEPLWKNVDYRRMMLVFAKDPRAKLSKGVIVGQVIEGEMDKAIPGVGHNKNLSTVIRIALPPGNYRVQRLRAGPFAPVAEQQVELKPGEDTKVSWARGDGSSVRGKATWPANLMFVRQPGEAPRKLDWTVPDTATVRIAPIGADGKSGQPIEAAKVQPDGSFFVANNLDPGKYKATATVYLPERDFRGGKRIADYNYSQEFTVPEPARGPFGSPPVEVEIKLPVGADGVRFIAADPPAAPAKPGNIEEPPAEKEKEPFTAWGKEVGGLQAGLGFKAGEKRAYHHGETATLVVRVRNVGKEEVKFEYLRKFFEENPPNVTDGEGKPVWLGEIFIELQKRHIPVKANLAAGKEVELYELKLELSSGAGLGIPKFPTILGTGKFQFQYEKVLGNSSSGSIKLDPTLSKLATGKLELEVKEPAADPPKTETAKGADAASPFLAELDAKIAALKMEREKLSETLGSNHPKIRKLDAEVETFEEARKSFIANNPQALTAKPAATLTAWGNEISGLQAGLGFLPGQQRAYSHGETVKVVLRVRNVGKEAVDFKHIWAFFVENPPTITDADGKLVRLPGPAAEGEHGPHSTDVAPGKEVELYEWKFELRPKGEGSKKKWSTIHGVGKFSLHLEHVVGPTLSNPNHPNPAMSKLATGKLELEIKPVAPPPAAEAPNAKLQPATETPGANIVKFPDAEYAKDGFPLDDLNGEGVMWNGEESGLSLGYRITGDEWRILGKDLKVELWVRNAGKEDVKFQILHRTDEGLRVKLTGKDGREHFAGMVPNDVPLFGMKHLLSPGQCIKVNDFSVGLLPPEQNARIGNELRFFVSPGWYQLVCEVKVPGFTATGGDRKQTVPGAGEWTGTITTRSLNVEMVAPDAPPPKPRIEHADVDLEKDGTLHLNRKKVTLDELKARAAKNAKKRFTIRADKDVPYAKVIEVVDALKAAGVTEFSFSEARVGDGKYRIANRTGTYEFDDKHGFSICRPSERPQWFTVSWPAEGDRPACALRTFPNVSDKTDGKWAVVWEPGTDVLWWVDDSEVGKMTLTDPARVIVDREGRTNNFSRDFGLPEEVKTEFRRLGFVIGRDKTPGLEATIGGNSGGQTIVSAELGWWYIEGTVTDADGKPLANVPVRVSTNQEIKTEKTDAKGAYRVDFSLPLQLLAHSRAVTVKPALEGFTERDMAKSGKFNVLLRAGEQPQRVRLADDKEFQPGPIPRLAERDLLPSQHGASPGKPGRADFVMLKAAK